MPVNDINDYIRRLEGARNALTDDVDNKVKIASDLNALRTRRLQQKGVDADGEKFTPYKAATVKSRIRKKLQVKYVDHTDTGLMFQTMKPVVESDVDGKTVIRLDPLHPDRKDVPEYLDNYRSGMWDFNDLEIEFAQAANKARVKKIIDDI